MPKHTSSASKLTSTELDGREESLKIREQEFNIKLEAIARKEKDLEKLIRLRKKEFKIREKRVARNEEALKKAELAPQTCERCCQGSEGCIVPNLPSYNLLD